MVKNFFDEILGSFFNKTEEKKFMKVGKKTYDVTGWDESAINVLKAAQEVHDALDQAGFA